MFVLAVIYGILKKPKEIIKELKKRQNDIHIFVGGPEVSFSSFELLEEGVDAICIGEGEESVWEYIQMLETKPREIRGIYTKQFPNKEYRKWIWHGWKLLKILTFYLWI